MSRIRGDDDASLVASMTIVIYIRSRFQGTSFRFHESYNNTEAVTMTLNRERIVF